MVVRQNNHSSIYFTHKTVLNLNFCSSQHVSEKNGFVSSRLFGPKSYKQDGCKKLHVLQIVAKVTKSEILVWLPPYGVDKVVEFLQYLPLSSLQIKVLQSLSKKYFTGIFCASFCFLEVCRHLFESYFCLALIQRGGYSNVFLF